MTKTLDKVELVRLAWLTELRRQGHRQCVWMEHTDDKQVCALQLLSEICPPDEAGRRRHWGDVAQLAGLTLDQERDVYRRNDGARGYHKHTFAEIADVVEGWFK